MTDTPNLVLPYILAAQSQKHVTHNEAIRAIDALVHLSVLDRDLATPPATPVDGQRYLVAASPTGAWAGQAGKVAAFQDGAWAFYAPREGWIAWIADENIAVAYDGGIWIGFSGGGGGGGVTDHGALTGLADDDHPQYLNNARGDARYTPLNPATLGVNATADTTTRLAIGSGASLFNHAGTGGHQVKVNKALAADTASFLFQTGFSGRAEMGTTGDDDFHFKVSANGTTWNEAILINRTTGGVTFPNTSVGTGTVTQVATGTGLTGGPFSTTGTIALANMAASTLKGNNTGATAAPADLTAAQVKTMLNLTGTNSGDQTITLSGDVAGTGTGAITATIGANAVTNAKAAQMAANTIKGNNTGATANSSDLTTAQVKTMLAIAAADVSGLAAIATSGSASNLTAGTIPAAQMPAHTGDVTSTAGSVALTIGVNAVTNAKAAQMAANTIKGNNTGASANAADLTAAQVNTMLPVFVASGAGSAKGLVPDPGTTAGATRYLREDGAWFTPAGGGGGSPGGTSGQVQFNSAGAFGGFTVGGDATLDTSTGALTIGANAVTNAKASQMPANTIKGNNTGAAANATDLTVTQLQAMLTAEPTVQTFTASGTWTKPAGCRRVRVRVVGGGGGGGGATAAASTYSVGSGGGAGAFSEGIFDVTATASVAVTVGSGGTAGVAANGTGGAGGTSAFGTLIQSVAGGAGGISSASGTAAAYVLGGAAGTVGTGGNINAGGSPGTSSIRQSGTVGMSGNGASGPFGGAGIGSSTTVGGARAGGNGTGAGSGGGGALSSSATGFAGGAGAAGIVIVEEFY